MSNNQVVIKTLVDKRDALVAERSKMLARFDEEIAEIDDALHTLTGRRASEVYLETTFDDEHPDYIRQSPEEM